MHRIILDTDPGIDDALAFFLALASPEIQLEAITTVSGNVDVEQTTRNALTLLQLLDRGDIPVARGSRYPIVRTPVEATEVHGANGLGNIELPPLKLQPIAQHAADLIIEKVHQYPGEITLVAIGPLTNLALALRKEPGLAQHVREVVIMGGAVRVPGNVTPCAEFNIFADPHAAHMVFHAGWPLRLVSLDVTQLVTFAREHIEEFTRSGGVVKDCIRQVTSFYFERFAPFYGISTFQMHDPLCLATVFQPDLVTWEEAYVDVELHGTLTLGETVAYFNDYNRPDKPNMRVSSAVDAERFI
ncbi:MAG: nucleoside hydrolase, partial [Ktedonobacteraceae bacterium]|nr:nucleoside hydrolase [Ktedonobacteraceae bacterium]